MTRARKKAAPPSPPPLPALERVTLEREHEHQGEKKPAGSVITVHPETARWLRAVGVVSQPSTLQKD